MNKKNEQTGYENNQPDSQNLYNQDNLKNQQNPYGNQNGYNDSNYNSQPPYGNQPYGPPPPYGYQNNQNEFEMQSASTASISKAYIWLYFISVALFFIACVLAVANSYAVGLIFVWVGLVLIFVNFILSIVLAVKVNALSKFSTNFSTPFIFFIIGIFINLFSVIAAFMTLSRIKKAKQPMPHQPYQQKTY